MLLIIAIYISFPAYFLKDAETRINILAGKTLGPIDLTMGFTPERTLQMVAEYGDEARAYYATVESTITNVVCSLTVDPSNNTPAEKLLDRLIAVPSEPFSAELIFTFGNLIITKSLVAVSLENK